MATRLGLPVSTTHSIMGGLIGVGFATIGGSKVNWGWGGVSQVFAAWLIAPAIAGAFSAIIFLFSKHGIMNRSNPAKKAAVSIPFYFFLTVSLIVMLIAWKGAKERISLNGGEIAGTILGSGAGVAVLSAVFLVPFAYRKATRKDWQLKWYHVFQGPRLLKRGEVPPAPPGLENAGIPNYYPDHKTVAELDAIRAANRAAQPVSPEEPGLDKEKALDGETDAVPTPTRDCDDVVTTFDVDQAIAPVPAKARVRPEGKWFTPAVAFYYFKQFAFRGVEQDVVSAQKKHSMLSGDLEKTHAHAARFDNNAEYMFSFLQILTATAASFTHGANDISNAVGPYATIYEIWRNGAIKNDPVPYWILAFGGCALVLGLWLYGYRIMRNLGNRLTLMSPARGFSMELGTCITLVFATRLKLPVSTTQCITGAIVGVGLCNGDWRAINWRMVGWVYFGWFITLPVTAIFSGCLMGIIINAPRYGLPI